MSGDKKSPLVWVIAGEPSGDLIGARLMVALRERTGGDIQIAGIGGEAMEKEGLKSLFSVSDIAELASQVVEAHDPAVLSNALFNQANGRDALALLFASPDFQWR